MRKIEYTSTFKRDYKKVKATPKYNNVDSLLSSIFELLQKDSALPLKNRDHNLTGNWKDFRECHVKPDLLLIYQKINNKLILVRLGSHSQLGL
jgi:mRNA interferase YafQ